MTQGERVKMVRDKAQLTMEQFGNRIGGVSKSTISNIENDNRNLTEHMLKSICREFDVNEKWLKSGEGDMPRKLSEEEEVAALVSDLLEDGRDNPFFGIILEIVQTYNELSPASQKVLQEASKKLVENLSKRKRANAPSSLRDVYGLSVFG
ncbi:MAG: helix-turn-helix domain-containing protein [Lachnospiraceae bacterium]